MLVLQITLSNIINIAGSMQSTTTILISAPRAISEQSELIMSMLEYMPTPNVAAKKLIALTIMDFMLDRCAIRIASFLPSPPLRSFS